MNKSQKKKKSSKDAKENEKEDRRRKELLQQIKELKTIIEQCEYSLNTLQFKDVENKIERRDTITQHLSEIPNVVVQLQNDLYKFAGFSCIKLKRNELVFNLSSVVERRKDNTQALQIFIKDGKASLGKWVMPMSIDMDKMLNKISIETQKNLTIFIKSCKHSTDCYTIRQEQFLSLKNHISNLKDCNVYSDIGYMQISLELNGVHDTEKDYYFDLIIYLLYNSDEARPYKVNIDITNKNMSSKRQKELKACLKEFKKLKLKTAFDKILKENKSSFIWIRENDSDSPLEMIDFESSDEECSLKRVLSYQRKSLRIIKRKAEIQKKWKERMKQKNTSSLYYKSHHNDDNHSMTEANESSQVPIKKKSTKSTARSSKKRKNIDESILDEITPVNKLKVKLKQTKLNFQTKQLTNDANEKPSSKSKSQQKSSLTFYKKQKKGKLITSTPLSHKMSHTSHSEIDNITQIGSPRNLSE